MIKMNRRSPAFSWANNIRDSESVAKAEISTAPEEGLLQNELPLQEAPDELHPQQPQNSLDESSTHNSIPQVE
ncbi:Spermatogenesis-associated glutamate (E)-rich protein 2 [Apodemus speciosus]|uniref:Spermatogenesis-associated glutamate (E)-rich protein 2 n=1 Tax=Apodemus speciosus TaxID=105296 RepID=A0ABQ0FVP9_APOSI